MKRSIILLPHPQYCQITTNFSKVYIASSRQAKSKNLQYFFPNANAHTDNSKSMKVVSLCSATFQPPASTGCPVRWLENVVGVFFVGF